MPEALPDLRRFARPVFFTGAGLSAESGIATYRGEGGVWTRYRYEDYACQRAFRRAPERVWEFHDARRADVAAAAPNAAHRLIAAIQAARPQAAIVTQNIDGLHQAAGTAADQLIELHGTNAEVECVQCRRREPCGRAMAEFERTREPPTCVHCGALLKPAVVMFGQALDMALLGRALRAAERADLILALGSSLVVTPAADVPLAGARRGTPYVIVNRGETAHDRLATLRIDDDVVRVLPAAITRR